MNSSIYSHGIDKREIIQQYIDIAFVDICDYIEFGTEGVMTKDGSECLDISDVNSVVRNFN
ncbi:MAG: hypothetical protein RR894_14860, partial [Terrisporobacter sp.]